MAPPELHHPEFLAPQGFTSGQKGSQLRLVPPGATLDTAMASIIVSPLIARHERLPLPADLILLALETEKKAGFEVVDRKGPNPFQSATGLAGVSIEVQGFTRPAALPEHRLYVLYSDALCYYGINYVAFEESYPKYLNMFLEVARSIKPVKGRALAPPQETPVADDGSPIDLYID